MRPGILQIHGGVISRRTCCPSIHRRAASSPWLAMPHPKAQIASSVGIVEKAGQAIVAVLDNMLADNGYVAPWLSGHRVMVAVSIPPPQPCLSLRRVGAPTRLSESDSDPVPGSRSKEKTPGVTWRLVYPGSLGPKVAIIHCRRCGCHQRDSTLQLQPQQLQKLGIDPFQNRWADLRRRTTPSPISPMPSKKIPAGVGSGTVTGSNP